MRLNIQIAKIITLEQLEVGLTYVSIGHTLKLVKNQSLTVPYVSSY